jgi:hypothetical protein
MRGVSLLVAMAGCAALVPPAMAAAQPARQPPAATSRTREDPRVFVSVSAGVEASDDTVSQSFAVQKNLEPAPITVDARRTRGVLFDAGFVVRLKGAFGVGLAASYAKDDAASDIGAMIPHPFFFNQPRTVTGTAPLARTETAAHVEAAYIASGRRHVLMVVGGPSVFQINQTLVTDILYADAYPYDAPIFTAPDVRKGRRTAIGFHVGADFAWRFSAKVGIGGLIRFARASTTLDVANNTPVRVHPGGVHASGGLRLAF